MNVPDIEPVSVVICDDDELARKALALLLSERRGIKILANCATTDECLRSVREQPPQVAIIDLQLKGGRSGIELIRRIRADSPGTVCMVLTATDTRGDALPDAFLAGAHGFRRKGYVAGDDLPEMVKRLAAGDWEIDPELASILMNMVNTPPVVPAKPPNPDAQSMPAEYAVLKGFAEGGNTRSIATALRVAESTVYTLVRNITSKFHSGAVSAPVRAHASPC